MEYKPFASESRFKNPQEEIAFLQSEILRHENELKKEGIEPHRESIIHENLSRYKETPPNTVIDGSFRLNQESLTNIVGNLSPEPHDKQIESLIVLLNTQGIKNTLSI